MDKQLFIIIDELASEYSWTLEYILSLDLEVIQQLRVAMQNRRKEEYKTLTKLNGFAVAAANAGKLNQIDKLFTGGNEEDINEFEYKEQMRTLWLKLGKKPEDFEEQYSKGEVKF